MKYINNGSVPLPNLFLIGPPKTATTSLAYWLGQSKDIFISEPKEPLFFEAEYENGVDFYKHKYFRHWNGEKIICDARPMNCVISYVPERIYETCGPDIKIIMVIRDRLQRSYSEWHNYHRMRPGRTFNTFHEAIKNNLNCFNYNKFLYEYEYIPFRDSRGGCYVPSFIEGSLYGNMIEKLLNYFKPENIILIDFNDIINDSANIITKLFHKLDVESHIIDLAEKNMIPKIHNSVQMQMNEIDMYNNYPDLLLKFHADNNKLNAIMGHNDMRCL